MKSIKKQNQKEFMEINQKSLVINKLNESRSQMQQDKFNHSADLIQIPNISPQDNYSIWNRIWNNYFHLKVFLEFYFVSPELALRGVSLYY